MKLGMIGLGRMGLHMSQRLHEHGLTVVGYNRSPEKVEQLIELGAEGAFSIEELLAKLDDRKILWLMLPAGAVTDTMIQQLLPLLSAGDIIINGANAFFKEAQQQSQWCEARGVHLFDAGVSGGVHGLTRGYALMIGGPQEQFGVIEDAVKALAPAGGYGYFGEVGAGHFVKSVHNIIEYVFLQGLAEGFDLLSRYPGGIDLLAAAKTWQPASIVSSALLDWAVDALEQDDFDELSPRIGSVTLEELTKTVQAVDATDAAQAFMHARDVRLSPDDQFVLGKKIIAGIRREFGGHGVTKHNTEQ